LYLGRIPEPASSNKAEIQDVCSSFGEVLDVKIMSPENIFVTFSQRSHAENAKNVMNGQPWRQMVGSEPIRVRTLSGENGLI
jgi:RNA recognition motif-containing protein